MGAAYITFQEINDICPDVKNNYGYLYGANIMYVFVSQIHSSLPLRPRSSHLLQLRALFYDNHASWYY